MEQSVEKVLSRVPDEVLICFWQEHLSTFQVTWRWLIWGGQKEVPVCPSGL